MKRPDPKDNWERMLGEMLVYRKKHGDCNVPANFSGNLHLGRWVAAQRHKKTIGDLSDERARQLDAAGFLWSPADESWNRMYKELAAFRNKKGHCNVPETWAGNRSLANWVQTQRHRKRKKKLSSERIALLEKIDFSWAIYKCDEPSPEAPKKEVEAPIEYEEPDGEKLYVIAGTYVQFNGKGELPKELEKYQATHKGELPPYIPLPTRPTTYYIGDTFGREKKLKWKGKGPLPEEVLIHARKNGTLPRYE